jgi:hypothetical protein
MTTKNGTQRSVVYDGDTPAGEIIADAAGFTALTPVGKKLGVFKTRLEAVRAVLAAHNHRRDAEAKG